MSSHEAISEACAKYIDAVFRAKQAAESEEQFWSNGRASRAYQRLFKAVEGIAPNDLHWGFTIWDIAGSTSDRIWQGRLVNEPSTVKALSEIVENCLEDLANAEWIACVPMERRFSAFPEYTDFGEFAVVNAAEEDSDFEPLLNRFRKILATKLGVNFMPETEVQDSLLRLDEHYLKKSGHYIPGRPQLVARVGRGERFTNKRLLEGMANDNFAMLSLCQIAYDMIHEIPARITTGAYARLPSGEWMPEGLIEIPPVAVAINARTGEADWWTSSVEAYETIFGEPYDANEFELLWKRIVVPILNARNAGLSGTLRDAIDSAIKLVGKCRHRQMADLTLHCVIATETILNPFNVRGDTGERFAIFCAGLTANRPPQRVEAYRRAKKLYRLRSGAVHQSRRHNEREIPKQAFQLFLACLNAVVSWASSRLTEGNVCTSDDFNEFYVQTVFATKENEAATKT